MEILKEEDLEYLIRITFEDLIEIHYSLYERVKALSQSKLPDRKQKIRRITEMIDKLEVLL